MQNAIAKFRTPSKFQGKNRISLIRLDAAPGARAAVAGPSKHLETTAPKPIDDVLKVYGQTHAHEVAPVGRCWGQGVG
eukprot:SAG11_NODE_6046_length_1401_cov_1.462366_1_plen_78_part_00